MSRSLYIYLQCHQCDRIFDKNKIHHFCPECQQPLTACYDLQPCKPETLLRSDLPGMWRYFSVLPVEDENSIIYLGEGQTPLLPLHKDRKKMGRSKLYIKDESANPTGSFKARGMGMAVSKATELGITSFCVPTAGNAGSALAAYAAAAGGESHIYMPVKTPVVFQEDCVVMGAKVTKVEGSIRDAGLLMARENKDEQWFDISTLKEPFRLEGKKTMGYEIAEQLQWQLPDVIIYPTGGGTGLIGIWKAFQEMKTLGWINHIPTRMIAVQMEGCRPVVDAFENRMDHCMLVENPEETAANGLRVPKAFGDRLIMKTIYESHGEALAITEQEMLESISEFAGMWGIFLSPEGGAVYAAYKKLAAAGSITEKDITVLINTGSPYKYIENNIVVKR